MKRAIVTPPVLSPAALDELKQWLGISTAQDDAPLTSLLRAALETCEAFTGSVPIQADCEEVLPLSGDWQNLQTRPVQAITAVQSIAADGSRSNLPASAYAIDLDADGGGRVLISAP
ncbi:MAG: phage head-tail connector protein, partial [Novosphingobium sp.]